MILIYQYYNSLILTIPLLPPIPMWPNLHHHPPVLSVSAVSGSLEHILAVPKHDCLGTSKDACRLDHGTCHSFRSTVGLQWESGACISVYRCFFSSGTPTQVMFLSYCQVSCAYNVNHMKLSSFSPTLFPEKIPERCASMERLKSLMEDWCSSFQASIFCISAKWEQGKGSHSIVCLLAKVKFLGLILE